MTDEAVSEESALPEERRLLIAARVRRDARVRVDDLARRFGVSGETVRRDLQVLEERGLVRRVYGGAVVAGSDPAQVRTDPPSADGSPVHRRIAALAATLVEPDDTVAVHGGSVVGLVQQFAAALPASFTGRVLCASLPVAAELAGRAGVDVLIAGGQVRQADLACSGPVTEHFFRQYYADKVFLSAGGIHHRTGLTQRSLDDIAVQQVMVDHARECYVLADPASLGRTAVGRVAAVGAVTAVVTDGSADPAEIRALEQAGLKVLVAQIAQPDPDAD
ncbi:DeoR/GlpR family DNA-binding transcription regulator [Virgisporangium ochraceum]|uniref:DeoR family transcriptional regulator n=1 Tax=Virgisporangium ochraceum TaxID=65505 RepID=A0A8J3ZZS1_9ACTN|nr:DeoR/GlpR family DNA-binding transcription regulator [Virgisporangium ochraceum]GIJ73067.1 DeoR family transcriptional regulator [Virgisporangium ochraceum]